MANLWLKTTYNTDLDLLTTIDTWLVNTMNYTRNMAPTSDTVSVTGYKSHYQYTFPTGEVGCLTFKSDTSGKKIYVNSSKSFNGTSAWNNQPDQTRSWNNTTISPKITYVEGTSKMVYLFGDLKGNIQIFVQKGTKFDSTSLIQFGVLDKTGFGSWVGGLYVSCYDLGYDTPTTPANETTVTIASPVMVANTGETDYNYPPRMFVDVTYNTESVWAGMYQHNYGSQSYEMPLVSTLGSYASTVTKLILFPDVCVGDSNYSSQIQGRNFYDYTYTSFPNRNSFTSMQDLSGYVCSITGRIFMYSPMIHIRHESTGRISLIGRMPFGFHCPVASVSSLDAIMPGTEIVQNGRTFVLMGNIAAEKVVR
jgi:hypothetical protein